VANAGPLPGPMGDSLLSEQKMLFLWEEHGHTQPARLGSAAGLQLLT
jgi:hypothetical protein